MTSVRAASAPTQLPAALGVPMSAEELRTQVNAIQQLMEAVMREGEHYGRICGYRKPSLWKPGAEKLCVAFHIEPAFVVEDLSNSSCYRYRVKCIGTHQPTGKKLGEGMGACSSLEQRFKWRRASDAEFENTSAKRRRYKYYFAKDKLRPEEVKQVRFDHQDLENTILKMACKRALVAMTLNVTAASDIFTQDIEELPEYLRDGQGADIRTQPRTIAQPRRRSKDTETSKQAAGDISTEWPGPSKAAHAGEVETLSEGQKRSVRRRLFAAALSDEAFEQKFGLPVEALPAARFDEVTAWIRKAASERR